jgi:hypothetical protein
MTVSKKISDPHNFKFIGKYSSFAQIFQLGPIPVAGEPVPNVGCGKMTGARVKLEIIVGR